MLKDAAINGGCNQIMVAAVYDMLLIVLVILGALIGFLTLMNGRWRPFRVPFRVRDRKRPALGIILVNAKNLSFELKRVTNWPLLGINLGVPVYELTKITKDYKGRSDQQRLQMLNLWLQRTPTASWEEVVHALELMGERREAERIQRKYGNREPDTVGIAQGSKQKIEAKFAVLLTNVCKKLREKPIDFTELQMFFTSFFSQGKCIAKSSNIHETFDMLTRHKLWDYWNYYPLERLVQAFAADDQEIQSWIETYKQDLRSYKLTTKLIDHIAAVDFDSSYGSPSEEEQLERPARYDQQYYRKLSLKLKTKVSDQTLHYIEDLWEEFAELYDLPPHKVLLESISKGCVLIVWLVPTHLAPQILHTVPHSDDFYRKHEIMRVEFGGKCIYQEKELDEDPHFHETETAEELGVWIPKQDLTISLLTEMQKGIASVINHTGAARIRQNTELAKGPTLK